MATVGPLLSLILLSELVQGPFDTIKSPRGVRGFKLNEGTFGTWKVQGKIGGYTG